MKRHAEEVVDGLADDVFEPDGLDDTPGLDVMHVEDDG